jgi:hypothetical protein
MVHKPCDTYHKIIPDEKKPRFTPGCTIIDIVRKDNDHGYGF